MQTHDDPNRQGGHRVNRAVRHAVALVGVGAIAGGIVSATLSAGAATATTTTTTAASGSTGTGGSSTTSSPPAGSGRQRPTAPPGGAALALHGTVTAVSASSVTIKTSTGTTTYAVTATSDIEKNGKTGSSALSTGDVVAFSTVTTDGSTAIDKLVAGGPAGMAGGCGPGGAGAKPGRGQGPPPGAGTSESVGSSGTAGGSTGTQSTESSD